MIDNWQCYVALVAAMVQQANRDIRHKDERIRLDTIAQSCDPKWQEFLLAWAEVVQADQERRRF